MKENIYSLFNKTNKIIKRNEEIIKLKQEHFNIFSILRKDDDEVKLHSNFISELINPKGSHKYGDKFLILFLKELNIYDDFYTPNISVQKEKGINEGRADIYITNNKNDVIIIENKIYADDQDGQLCRYSMHLKEKGENSKLIYLTLFGVSASGNALKCETDEKIQISEKDYIKLSYHTNIKEWLIKCMKETYNFPILRETIKQYLILIKKLTKQLNDKEMEKELHELIKNNYQTAKTIQANIQSVENNEVNEVFNEIKSELKKILSNDWIFNDNNDFLKKWGGISIRHKEWNKNISIGYQGQPYIFKDKSVFGFIGSVEKIDQKKYLSIINNIEGLNLYQNSEQWIKYRIERDFNKDKVKEELFDKEGREKIKNKIISMFVELAKKSEDVLKEENL